MSVRTTVGTFPLAALVGAAALWGLATTGTKFALGGFAPVTLLSIELVAAAVALWAALLVRGYRRPESWLRVLVLAALEPAGAYLADTLGLDRTSASNGAVLTGLESAFVVLLALVFLREPLHRNVVVAAALALVGLATLEHDSWLTGPGVGDALVLVGALSAAGYTIVARGIGEDSDSLALTAHQFAVAALMLMPVALARWSSGAEPLPAHVALRFWVVAVLVGLCGFGASFLMYNWAIAFVEAGPSAIVINLIPAFGFVGAVTLLGEAVTATRLMGASLITASVVLFATTEHGHDPALAPEPDAPGPALVS